MMLCLWRCGYLLKTAWLCSSTCKTSRHQDPEAQLNTLPIQYARIAEMFVTAPIYLANISHEITSPSRSISLSPEGRNCDFDERIIFLPSDLFIIFACYTHRKFSIGRKHEWSSLSTKAPLPNGGMWVSHSTTPVKKMIEYCPYFLIDECCSFWSKCHFTPPLLYCAEICLPCTFSLKIHRRNNWV